MARVIRDSRVQDDEYFASLQSNREKELKAREEAEVQEKQAAREAALVVEGKKITVALMDCVGCEKCRFWGKLQVLGLGGYGLDEKLQSVLGHFQRYFNDGVIVESRGAAFGGYGSFLPMHQHSPLIRSDPKTPQISQNYNRPRSPNNLHLEGEMEQPTTQDSNVPQSQLSALLENDVIQDISDEHELEMPTETESQSTVTGKKRKGSKLRSKAWAYYDVVEWEEGDPLVKHRKGICKVCRTEIQASSGTNGTSALMKHTAICKRRQAEKSGQKKLRFQPGVGEGSGTLTSWRFDPKASRLALCEMIILDELPFRFVEKEGFKKFVARVCPDFMIPSRQTIREDCGMRKDWVLQKKIIAFRKIVSHKGVDIGEAVVQVLKEWGLEKILCCTVDNASANDGAVRCISDFLDSRKTNILGGKYLHLRCVAHIANLIVMDGLEEIGLSVRRVREAVKWVKASPKRLDDFNRAVKAFVTQDCGKSLCLDVPTRWNSTYLMLEAAEPFEPAFRCYSTMQSGQFVSDLNKIKYKDQPLGPPFDNDWINVRKMMDYLKIFYDFTLLVSGTAYVTAHLFFKEMCAIFEMISDLEMSVDEEVSAMAMRMKEKVGKYWLEEKELNPKMNKLLYMAAVLDPRQKLKHVEMCLDQVYGPVRGNMLVSCVRASMTDLFDEYKSQMTIASNMTTTPQSTSDTSQSQSQTLSTASQRQRPKSGRARSSLSKISRNNVAQEPEDLSELAIYLGEKQYVDDIVAGIQGDDDDSVDSFDVLQWWMKHGARFPVLSEMARDILATPISTVASESAFSTGGRVLNQFRSSLTPKMVEALICSSNWLRSSTIFVSDEEEGAEEEEESIFGSVGSFDFTWDDGA
ncbi:hypothetical protein OROMI_017011 [Orobanche minor]